jgi:hypothetical protein
MIEPTRFIAPSSVPEAWHAARANGVTATQVSKAATPAGFRDIIAAAENPVEFIDNDYMKFGRDQEANIMFEVKNQYGIFANDWLIAAEELDWHLATPDGLSLDHAMIAEVKTTGKDWGDVKKIPIHYRRQVQWQLHVTGADVCVFAWMLRVETPSGEFVPGWLEPKFGLIHRDQNEIESLQQVAHQLRMHEVYKSQQEGN